METNTGVIESELTFRGVIDVLTTYHYIYSNSKSMLQI
jgi:hypothetical protein